MKIIREVRNVLDGKYTVRDNEDERKRDTNVTSGIVGGESRVVRKLIDAGLLIPQNGGAKAKKRG